MSSALTDRYLSRLRWSLTLLFAAATAAALAILAVVALRIDNDLRWTDMGETLLSRAQLARQAVAVNGEGDLDVDRYLEDDGLVEGWPQSWIFEDFADGEVLALAGPIEDWYDVDVADHARRVLHDNVDWTDWVGVLENESEVYGRGVPIVEPESGEAVAVAVAVVDSADFFTDHETLRGRLVLAVIALTLGAAASGHWLARRGTAATAAALAQQERLLSDAAHELRTPVAKIRAVAESGLAGDESADDALGRVARLGEDAGQMVDDMLVLARMDAGREAFNTEPVRLDLLVEELAGRFDDIEVSAVETIVEADPGLMRRAVSNLIRNALTHGGGSAVRVTAYPSVVIVADDGPGLAPEVASRVFERFHTGGGSGGHGLGLPIVAWIADAHGGKIEVVERDEGGVTAKLTLPG